MARRLIVVDGKLHEERSRPAEKTAAPPFPAGERGCRGESASRLQKVELDPLPANPSAGQQNEQHLVNEDRGVIVAGQGIDDPAADNGGNPAKHQNPQLPADIHISNSPVAAGNHLWRGVYLHSLKPTDI
jgi:hypothetical protein